MTLQELYQEIGGDYNQAISVLRMENLIDKHIRKLTKNGVISQLLAAGESLDHTQMFEAAHAIKGVCGNLGLRTLANMASEIADEFRAGNSRKMTDDEVREKLKAIEVQYRRTEDGIRRYEEQE